MVWPCAALAGIWWVMLLAHDIAGPSDATSLVLIHGITESLASWQPIAQRLADQYRVLCVDLRGHGASPSGDAYDPLSYAGDVMETIAALELSPPIVIGHSLGGVVASALAAMGGACAVINVDQPLRLAGFKDGLAQLEPMLRGDDQSFRGAIAAMFASMDGPLSADERARINASAHPDRDVVLGTWDSVLTSSVEELDATVEQLASAVTVPYLALHGIDPGDDYAPWLTGLVRSATVELWADHGHYPHLVDTTRFLARVDEFVADLV
jgi:pimeloyl-ACP methyl ester carboxylesterase